MMVSEGLLSVSIYRLSCEQDISDISVGPLAPGHSTTYTFQATQFGTSWYHSYASAQYGDGLFGPIVIAGPSSANYDIDMGLRTLSDWYYNYISTQLDIQDFDGANYGGGHHHQILRTSLSTART